MFSTNQEIAVLVPLDGSALAEEALQPAIELSQAFSLSGTATLHLLCVLPLFVQYGVTDKEGSPLMHDAQRYLKELEVRLLRECPPTMHLHLTSSLHYDIEVAQAILDASEKGHLADQNTPGCECIAMATHGRKGLARWAIGSITELVLSRASRPLLIVRPASIRKAHSGPHEIQLKNGKTQEEWQQHPFVGLF
ncbi:universal stress protein [Ktedonobacter sp. SOSP1-85]|uniref:universal stress protein n=1 Tax=Ktedonobacter sp. SOSP1-85 TaxID=2778367 RepID=UPI001916554A|nr:universal stress protein [Ktedonobacter sp. SOSP1-85]GHO77658.1 universal stress protein [Ktedonobacter sp. SOSP1-85]